MTDFQIITGNSLDELPRLAGDSIDSCVTDPPYFLINDSGLGFMGKEWDGIINLWKCLWQSPEFVSTAASLLTYCRVDSTTDEASIVPANASTPEPPSKTPDNAPCAQINSLFSDVLKNASVRLIAVTKHDLLASLNGSSPSLTKMLAASLNGVSENASFVLPILLPKAESSNTVVRNVTRLLKAKECQERQTTFTKTETARIKEVIVEMAGGTFASKSTPEINGLVDFVESTATGEKYNATILRPTLTAELTKNLTLLLFASLVTRRWNEILQDLIKTFFTLIFREVYRTLKPGGYVLAFAGTRTYQYLASAIEDAGFEIRDQMQWIYGSGFPKSRDIGKDIEKLKVGGIKNLKQIGSRKGLNNEGGTQGFSYQKEYVPGVSIGGKQVNGQIPVYEITNDWQGFGTALKPANEPICLARKPLEKGLTVAQNVLKWGTGAINVDGCRVGTEDKLGGGMVSKGRPKAGEGWDRPWMHNPEVTERKKIEAAKKVAEAERLGRWPANLIHDGSEEVVGLFPATTSGKYAERATPANRKGTYSGCDMCSGDVNAPNNYGDEGSAARFFYSPKASKYDREAGLREAGLREAGLREAARPTMGNGIGGQPNQQIENNRNHHPTVKPTDLMQYLCRLITPPGGLILDPFLGSGSTAKAALIERFRIVGIELNAEYAEIAEARLNLLQVNLF